PPPPSPPTGVLLHARRARLLVPAAGAVRAGDVPAPRPARAPADDGDHPAPGRAVRVREGGGRAPPRLPPLDLGARGPAEAGAPASGGRRPGPLLPPDQPAGRRGELRHDPGPGHDRPAARRRLALRPDARGRPAPRVAE